MPWSIVLLKTLMTAQLTKKFPAFSKGSSLCKIQVSTVVNITVHWSPTRTLYAFICSMHATCPINLIIYLIIQIMFFKNYKLRRSSMQSSRASYYLIPLRSKYSLQHLFPPSVSVLPLIWEIKFHTYKTTEKTIVFYIAIMIFDSWEEEKTFLNWITASSSWINVLLISSLKTFCFVNNSHIFELPHL